MIKINSELYKKISNITDIEYNGILYPHTIYEDEFMLVDDDSIKSMLEDMLYAYHDKEEEIEDLINKLNYVNDEDECPDCTLDNDRQYIANSIRNGGNW
jgi:hypothetical protein